MRSLCVRTILLIAVLVEFFIPASGATASFCSSSFAANSGEEMVTLFRGVSIRHPGQASALEGSAIPWGGTATAAEHNAGNTMSNFTSWSTHRGTAVEFGNLEGPGGVLLEMQISRSRIIPSPDLHLEWESLLEGPVHGATPTILGR